MPPDYGCRNSRPTTLSIRYAAAGPLHGPAVLLLHGWPDNALTWGGTVTALHAAGFRTVVPDLRGFGGTRFRSADTPRDGRGVALAQDAVDLMDGLGIDRFAVVGHDWGARTAYTLATLFPERVAAIVALSVAYQPNGQFVVPPFAAARLWWYQWLMCTDSGAEQVRQDPVAFVRAQWDTWSPPGWFSEADFAEAAEDFANPDFAAVTLHAYRSRWRPDEPGDPRYASLQHRLERADTLAAPTLLIQGKADACDPPRPDDNPPQHFPGGSDRVLLEGVGHFPTREAPVAVGREVVEHLRRSGLEGITE